MEKLTLTTIETCREISPADFRATYADKLTPVILKNFSNGWPAREKWTFNYFKKHLGKVDVPLYREPFADKGNSYLAPQLTMPFAEYLDIIANKPSQLRMFLFNIFKHMPQLCEDFNYPSFMNKYLTKFPFMFFGGGGSWVDVHYDADLSHVFLTQFHGKRRIKLFAPNYSIYLYRHPLTVSTNVDVSKPDFKQYPLLQYAKGFECILEPGDTLFIPSGYWHHIYYLEGGFGLSLRAPCRNLWRRTQGLANIFKLTVLDHFTAKLLGAKKWYAQKEKMAVNNAARLAKQLQLPVHHNLDTINNE